MYKSIFKLLASTVFLTTFSVSAQTLVGELPGEFSVNNLGAASYMVPLNISPGTAGMEPKLAVNYSSRGDNGILGVGFSLGGLSAITRGGASLDQDGFIDGVDFDDNDRFLLDGQRLEIVALNGTPTTDKAFYGDAGSEYRTEIDSFSRVIAYGQSGNGPEWFKVWTKSGLIYEYGKVTDPLTDFSAFKPEIDPSVPVANREVLSWAVNKISDTAGNYMDFTYVETTAGPQISRIDYTGNAALTPALTPYNSVEFTYVTRPDPSVSFFKGVQMDQTTRLLKIVMKHNTNYIHDYRFEYISSEAGQSLLLSVQQFFSDGTEAISLPETRFEYDERSEAIDNFTYYDGASVFDSGLRCKIADGDRFLQGDFNGDGLTDICSMGELSSNARWVGLSKGNGSFTFTAGLASQKFLAGEGGSMVQTADFNGDGLTDIFAHGPSALYRWVGLSNGDGTFDFTSGLDGQSFHSSEGGSMVLTADFNGDGLTDICSVGQNSSYNWVGLSNGDGTFTFTSGLDNQSVYVGGSMMHTGDFNGDGLTDICAIGNDSSYNWLGLSDGDGTFTFTSGLDGLLAYVGEGGSIVHTADFNGDGLTDICSVGQNSSHRWLGLSDGDGTFTFTSGLDNQSAYVGPGGCVVQMGDFNGDGLTDICSVGQSSSNYRWLGLSKGDGTFTFKSESDMLASSLQFYVADPVNGGGCELRSGDFNGDGLTDLCSMGLNSGQRWIALSNGDGSFEGEYGSPLLSADTDSLYYSVGDYDGNGLTDLIGVPAGLGYTSKRWLGLNGNEAARLTKVTQGYQTEATHGVVTEIEYRPLTDTNTYVKGSGAEYPIRDMISPMHVVSTLTKDNGQGGTYDTDYTYRAARQHLHGRGFLGFQQFESYDWQTKLSYVETLAHDFPFTGRALQTETTYIPDPAGDTSLPGYSHPISRIENDWFFDLVAGGTLFTYSPRSVETKWELGEATTPISIITTLSWFEGQTWAVPPTIQPDPLLPKITHGNLIQTVVDYGGGLKQTTANTYDDSVDTTHWLLGRLDTSATTHEATGKPDVIRSASFDYYTDINHPSYGLLAQETIEPGDALFELVADYFYDDFGNIERKAITGVGIPTHNVQYDDYDDKGRFVEETRNALDYATTFIYDQAIGKPLSSTDPNTLTTHWQYDETGRTVYEERPDGTETTMLYTWDYTTLTVPDGPGSAGTIEQTAAYNLLTTTDGAAPATVWYDKQGREIRTQTQSADGRFVNRDTGYNAIAQPIAVSEPYFVVGGTRVYTFTEYDGLGRPQYVTAPDGTVVEQVYEGLTSKTISDSNHRTTGTGTPKHQVTTTLKNARGDMLSVTDATLVNTIAYDYDAAGNLTRTIDPASNTIEIEYDLRGNKKRQDDPDMGEWFYTYNALDQLVDQTDANGNRIESTYDLLGRPSTRINKIMTSSGLKLEGTASWFYDGTANGAKLGTLRREEHRDALGRFINRKTFAYDQYVRPMFELRNYDSKWYYTTLRYDDFSRVEFVDRFWRPVGKEGVADQLTEVWQSVGTQNIYNQYSALTQVKDPVDNSIWWSCAAADYDQQGRLVHSTYGNGLENTTAYNPQTGLTEGIGIWNGTTEVSHYGFGYDRLGNLESRVHSRPLMTTLTETCTYDALNRLLNVDGASSSVATYDALGNIQTRTGISGTYLYDAAHPHAVATAGDCTYYYDFNGNVVRRDRNSQYEFTANWNSFNKPSSLFAGMDGSEFEYGVNGKRTRQLIFKDGTVRKKIYVAETYEIEEVLSNPTETDRSLWVWTPVHSRIYIDTPAGRVGIYQKAASTDGTGTVTKSWLHKDHLGSVIGISDASATPVITYQSYDAWGNQRDADDWTPTTTNPTNPVTDRGYTGHEMLSHLDLVHMNGRIYDPVIGRMISPDPIIQAPDNLQSYNRYSYVMNRPLSLTDPSGFISEGLGWNPNAVQIPNRAEIIESFSLSEQDRTIGSLMEEDSWGEFLSDYYIDGNGSLRSTIYFCSASRSPSSIPSKPAIRMPLGKPNVTPPDDLGAAIYPTLRDPAKPSPAPANDLTDNGLGTGGGVEKPKRQNDRSGSQGPGYTNFTGFKISWDGFSYFWSKKWEQGKEGYFELYAHGLENGKFSDLVNPDGTTVPLTPKMVYKQMLKDGYVQGTPINAMVCNIGKKGGDAETLAGLAQAPILTATGVVGYGSKTLTGIEANIPRLARPNYQVVEPGGHWVSISSSGERGKSLGRRLE